MKKINVELDIDERQEAALLELLPYWQQYTSKEDNSKPFEHFTIEKLFETIMQIGCLHTIWNKIEEEQFRQGLISTEEWLDKDRLTIAERKEKRQQAQQKEGACE